MSGRKGNQTVKSLFGAAIIFADIIAGTAAPGLLTELRKPHAHPAAVITAVAIYAVLVALTQIGRAHV